MLFDEKDLRVFDNIDSRSYFQEILQCYYSRNYRATIVLLYSFVIYDLFTKLQTMAGEGDKNATKKLTEINTMISDDEKYSKVENEIVQFFKDNCSLYFDRFIEDIEYLKNCRNKCAHLKVNDSSLYVPTDYQARMLICSMYDHILSVKAPFIMDLFSFAQKDVEAFSQSLTSITHSKPDASMKNIITSTYLQRMTFDSLKKSYKNFIHLLFIPDAKECIDNLGGLYAFTYTMTEYILKAGYVTIIKDTSIVDQFLKIKVDSLKEHSVRRNALIYMSVDFPIIMDIINGNESVFDYISKLVLHKPWGLKYYRTFFPRSEDDIYAFFKQTEAVQLPDYIDTLYEALGGSPDFNLAEFVKILVAKIPRYDGYDTADVFMEFFIEHLSDLTPEAINDVMAIYAQNPQCRNRGRDSADKAKVTHYISDHSEDSTPDDEDDEDEEDDDDEEEEEEEEDNE